MPGFDFTIFNRRGALQLHRGLRGAKLRMSRAQGCARRADGAGGDGDTHTQMLQAGFSHICSPAVGPRLSIAQLFQLKNVNSRERDTSVRESTAQQPHSSTGRSFAWHWRCLDAGGNGLGGKHPTLSRPDHRDVLSHAKHAVPSEGHSAGPVSIIL